MNDTSTILNMTEESLASMQTAGGYVMASKTGATRKVPLTDFAKTSDIPAAITVDSALSTTSANPVQNKVVTAAVNGKAASEAVAPEYSPSSTYPTVGTAVMHNGLRYVSNTAINTAEDWTPAHWTEKSVEDEIGSVKNGGMLTDASSVNVPNNAISTLATAQGTLTLNVNVGDNEVPNFAVEVTPSADCTLTVTKTVGNTTTTLNPSAAGGNSLTTGNLYQVTCVGSCWTLAEFTVPSP